MLGLEVAAARAARVTNCNVNFPDFMVFLLVLKIEASYSPLQPELRQFEKKGIGKFSGEKGGL